MINQIMEFKIVYDIYPLFLGSFVLTLSIATNCYALPLHIRKLNIWS